MCDNAANLKSASIDGKRIEQQEHQRKSENIVSKKRHLQKKRLLPLLLPMLAATEFIENSSFLFAAGDIAKEIRASPIDFAGVLAAFATGSMLMVVLQQTLTRQLGYRRYLLASLGLFQLGILGSLLSSSIPGLILARALEGLGAGGLFTSARILVVLLFSQSERGPALRRFISLLFVLSALGPALAAGLSYLLDWRAVFMVPLPLACLSTVGVWKLLPSTVGKNGYTPWRSIAGAVFLVLTAIAFLQLALSEARFPHSFSVSHLTLMLLISAVALSVWWWRQSQHQYPLLALHALNYRGYVIGLGLYSLYYLISTASSISLPIYANRVLGLDHWLVGLISSAGALIGWFTALAYLRWWAKSPLKPLLMASAAGLMAVSFASLANYSAGIGLLVAAVTSKGIFSSLFVLPLAGLTFRSLSDELFGSSYQLKNLLRHFLISGTTAATSLSLFSTVASYSSPSNKDIYFPVFAVLAGGTTLLAGMVMAQRKLA